jgi:hypothetical protein
VNAPSKVKMKRCRVCREPFMPRLTTQPCCYKYECQVTYATAHALKSQEKRVKADRKETRARKEKMKGLAEWLKDVEKWCNKAVRLRDHNEGCISCGTRNPNIQYAAGHYRTVKAASHLRFNMNNIHKQCNHHCNKQKSGNIVEYRKALVQKIGLESVEAIEHDNSLHRYTIEECKELIAYFKGLCKQYEQQLTKGD